MSGLSTRRRELLRRRSEIVEKMETFVSKEDDDDKPNDEQEAQFASLMASLAALDARIAQVEAAMSAAASKADDDSDDDNDEDKSVQQVQQRASGNVWRQERKTEPTVKRDVYRPRDVRGVQLGRFFVGLMHKRLHQCSYADAASFVDNRFGDAVVARALNSLVTGEGGALIPQDFLADLIELLRSAVVVRSAGPMEVGMPMGNLTIPRLAGGATAAYQGELDDITVSQERFDDVNFVAKKLACLVPVSNDLIRRAPIGVEEVVRDDLVQTIARREDLAFLRGDGTDKGPVGLKNLALTANKITIPAMPATPAPGDQLAAVLNAASTALLTLQNGMSRMVKPVWFMHPVTARFIGTVRYQVGGFYFKDEIEAGRWEGYPVYTSQQIPTNLVNGANTKGSEIYFVDMADFVIADTYNVVVDASDVAAYTTGGTMVSAFQRDQSLFRVISEHDCNMRHLQSLVVLTVVDWAFSGLPGSAGAPWSTQPLNPTWSQAGAVRPAVSTGANAPPTLTDPA